ncbi:pyridoxamine 5'-phosphate oxidase family protein [Mucilaginibacter terrae]|uniref:Pyridoxine 5'-phosphate oxidase superfamily flavin-nucleotide-binding protein n=1 Tax=Mucilaginibacter terrae TaxID=1955052 RepID=A0ABU3GQG1_9SPHI|nr:pyridoxamine 5'-phosphate oxidase family protein [Mucilaginibacter terrae]MDT3402023.1 putative pyridoxine 5'-phosphate oxidase superfamily flavin-nucleotide-binding protein [Mucilaginibacter terrae]
MNYEQIAFTDAVKKLQEMYGSRTAYERIENGYHEGGLTESEEQFISSRDSFYMASISQSGYPYIQHRGGPKGFIRVIDESTLGVVDFSGNRQYISVGNAAENPKVSLIMMDYPQRARLKLFADIKIVGITENPELFEQLDPAGYKHKAERMLLFTVKGYNWNCPQHITPRYTLEEIEAAFAERNGYIKSLEEEVKRLRLSQAD